MSVATDIRNNLLNSLKTRNVKENEPFEALIKSRMFNNF